MSNPTKSLTVFLDNIGRTIIGKVATESDSTLTIENPALVHIQTNAQTNQLQLQILPLFFKEFLSNKDSSTMWTFKKSSITTAEAMTFAPQFAAQYEQVFQPTQPAPVEDARVIKLFDE